MTDIPLTGAENDRPVEREPRIVDELYARVLARRAFVAAQETVDERHNAYADLGGGTSSIELSPLDRFESDITAAVAEDELQRPDHQLLLGTLQVVALLESDLKGIALADKRLLADYIARAMGMMENAVTQLRTEGSSMGSTWTRRYGLSEDYETNKHQATQLAQEISQLRSNVLASGLLERLP
ncbi:hypothetical protein KA093_00300, partial [Candidatus Saccharibacteria bacterium]|nr:hypothetical protein [Candidatus Saccharibacteria bacterium]